MKIIAHRGASRECPENTLSAFERAIEIGADAIETDVQRTKDGLLVLYHDAEVKIKGSMRKVEQLNCAELQQVHAEKGGPVPVLEELFDLAGGGIALCLELKAPGLVPEILALILKYGYESQMHLTSFLYPEILQVRKLCPEIPVSVTFSEWPGASAAALVKDGILEVSLARAALTLEKTAQLKKEGLGVRVYTVNDLQDAARLESWGVDAIFSDDPRAMRAFFNKNQR